QSGKTTIQNTPVPHINILNDSKKYIFDIINVMIKEYFIRAGKNRVNQQKKLIFSDTDTN
ncbi:TPA: hypothetical protein N7A34_005163, partial [Escherichia coli]